MRKWIRKASTTIILSILISSSFLLYAADTVTLNVDGMTRVLVVSPIVEEGTTLVGFREIFEILGAEVDWDQSKETVRAKQGEMEVKLSLGKTKAEKNGESIELVVPPKMVQGHTMVPLRFISEAFGTEVQWNGETKTIFLNTAPNTEVEEELIETRDEQIPVLEIKEEGTKITYEEALQKALKNSVDLKKLEEDIKITEERQENAGNAVTVERPSGNGIYVSDAPHINALLNLVAVNIGGEVNKYQKEIKESIVEYQVKTAFNSITNLKKDIEILKRSLEVSHMQLEIIKQKAQLGLESEYSQAQAMQNYEQQQKQLDSLYKTLDNQYISLNRLIGEVGNEKLVLDYTIIYAPMEEIDANIYALQSINKSPSVHIQEGVVKQAEYNLNLYTYSGSSDSYAIRKSQLEQARMDLTDVKSQLQDNIKNAYNQIHQTEKQYEVDQLELQKAKQQWEVAKTRFELGMIIEAELKQAELAVLKAQVDLEKTVAQYDLLKFAFQRPYLLSSGSTR